MTGFFKAEQPERFDEVYSMSDLHFGGVPGFQIFDQGELFARTVRTLAALPANRNVALVLNGDVVDFLAEPEATYLNVEGVSTSLSRIVEDAAFKPAFEALAAFVRTPHRTLVIGLGNHDVEMALPKGRAFLEALLCGGDDEARGRLRFVLDGTGYRVCVGKAHILFLHGNEVDAWNAIDHDTLRHLVRALNTSTPKPEWKPNPGTQLVIDVMNSIKRELPLVDLLKPETQPVPAVLVALRPQVMKKLASVAPLFVKQTGIERGRRGGLLGEDAAAAQPPVAELSSDAALRQLIPSLLPKNNGQDLLMQAEATLNAGTSPLDWSAMPEGQPRVLGMPGMLLDLVLQRPTDENLRDALQGWLSSDRTFDWSAEDESFRALDSAIGQDVDFLVAGHTHLERSLPRKQGTGHYFNSGTWVQLIPLTKALLADKQSFAPVLAAFKKGTLTALQEANLVIRRPTVVAIRSTPAGTRGVLTRARGEGTGAVLDEVPGTERTLAV